MINVGINGVGRMGRLILRALWGTEGLAIVKLNDKQGDAATLAHLLNFDSIHGRWSQSAASNNDHITIDGQTLNCSQGDIDILK